jgi:hypothetical protein
MELKPAPGYQIGEVSRVIPAYKEAFMPLSAQRIRQGKAAHNMAGANLNGGICPEGDPHY